MQPSKIPYQIKKPIKKLQETRQFQDSKNQREKKVRVFIQLPAEVHFQKNPQLQEIILSVKLYNQNLSQ